jgi:7-keto-8-aminopelargonate synthetase-like enzyme
MQVNLRARRGKQVQLADGRWVCEFVSCSYLGLDLHPSVLAGAQKAIEDWGVHLCCSRTRFTIGPLHQLEEGLSQLFGGRAVVFPSVTSAHMATLPVLAAGVLDSEAKPRLVYDRSAHASMQFLAPSLQQVAQVEYIAHNDLDALERHWQEARHCNQNLLYLADTIYSMGGTAPLEPLLKMAERPQFYLYLDDAHGTSVYGDRGEGYLLSQCGGKLPPRSLWPSVWPKVSAATAVGW